MTILYDRPATRRMSLGDEAIAAIDTFRHEIGEEFEVRPLEDEVGPHVVQRLGAYGVRLADATLNPARTFKVRGAVNKIAALHGDGAERIVVPSAGNHLRGAVVAARVLDIMTTGVVPTSAPNAKRRGARQLWPDGSKFQLHEQGETFDESLAWTLHHPELGALVHPYDDPLVAAGQGTILDDTLREAGNVKHMVVPVGGGGLFSGLARRALELDPSITIHGIEAEGSNSLSRSASAGRLVPADRPNKKYGGSAVGRTGQHTLATYETLPNMRLWSVPDEEVAAVIDDYAQSIQERMLDQTPGFAPLEPTSLVAVAGLLRIVREHPGESVAVVGTGRNDTLDAIWR